MHFGRNEITQEVYMENPSQMMPVSSQKRLKEILIQIDEVRKGKGEINLMTLRDEILNISKSCSPGSLEETILLDQVKYINEKGLRTDLNILFEKLSLFMDSFGIAQR